MTPEAIEKTREKVEKLLLDNLIVLQLFSVDYLCSSFVSPDAHFLPSVCTPAPVGQFTAGMSYNRCASSH